MPSYEKLLQLADFLDVSTDELLGRKIESSQIIRENAQEKRLLSAARMLNDAGVDELIRYAGVLSGNLIFTEKKAASSAV